MHKVQSVIRIKHETNRYDALIFHRYVKGRDMTALFVG